MARLRTRRNDLGYPSQQGGGVDAVEEFGEGKVVDTINVPSGYLKNEGRCSHCSNKSVFAREGIDCAKGSTKEREHKECSAKKESCRR